MTEAGHYPAIGECTDCRKPAFHHLREDGRNGYASLSFCCSCYTLKLFGHYHPGRCGEALTLEEMGFTQGTDGVWRNFPEPIGATGGGKHD